MTHAEGLTPGLGLGPVNHRIVFTQGKLGGGGVNWVGLCAARREELPVWCRSTEALSGQINHSLDIVLRQTSLPAPKAPS